MDDMFDTTEVTPGIGHNRSIAVASVDLAFNAAQHATTQVPAWLQSRHENVVKRVADLVEAGGRMPVRVKPGDTDMMEKLSDYRKQLIHAMKSANAARLEDKKVFDEPGKAIHSFWTKRVEQLELIERRVTDSIKAWMYEAEVAARKKQLAEQLKEEARNARLIAKGKEPTPTAAEPREVEKVTVAGDLGSVTSTRKVWVHKDVDPAQIDLEALRPYFTRDAIDSALRQYIRNGNRSIKGATIFEDTQITTR